MNKITKVTILAIFCCLSFASCDKDWLEEKSDQSLIIPSTLEELQGLLDNTRVFNTNQPYLGEMGSDNYFIRAERYSLISKVDQNIYAWKSGNIFEGASISDWNLSYNSIFYANVVLEGVSKVQPNGSNISQWQNVKGSALFHRAYNYFNLAQLFAKPYVESNAAEDLGLILRLHSNLNLKVLRSSLKETYLQIISDLTEAKSLLSLKPAFKTSPSKHAVYAMLARVYLTMEKYQDAFSWSDSSLSIDNSLLDFTQYSSTPANPLPAYTSPGGNSEVIFHSYLAAATVLPYSSGNGYVDSSLLNSYDINDLRKSLYFKKNGDRTFFAGSYTKSRFSFNGLANDEIYLIRAECYARLGDKEAALADLNSLLIKRWKAGLFIPISAANSDEALDLILSERRRELFYRGTRWSDLRRLNNDSRFAKVLIRDINSQQYSLEPKSNRYVYPIPDNEILLSGVEQNTRN